MFGGYNGAASSTLAGQRLRAAPGQIHPAVPLHWPGKKGKGMFETQWRACRDMLESVYAVRDGSRVVSAEFQVLPDRDEFPDYYQDITAPECLNNIASILAEQGYKSPEHFFAKLHLVFRNAKTYNAENSQIYQDAALLERQIHDDWRVFAMQGVFSDPDPTVNAPRKPGRPRKDDPPRPPQPTPSRRTAAPPTLAAATGSSMSYDLGSPASFPPSTGSPWIPHSAMGTAYPSMPSYGGGPSTPATAAATGGGAMYPMSQMGTPSRAAPPPQYHAPPPSTSASQVSMPPLPPRNGESDEAIMAKLDAQLPKWSGPPMRIEGPASVGGISGSGYWGEFGDDMASNTGPSMRLRIATVMAALEAYRGVDNTRLADVLDRIQPDSSSIPYLSYSNPLSLADFRGPNARDFESLHAFDHMMVRFFEKARRYFPVGSAEYGKVLVLQRLYNALTGPKPLAVRPGSSAPAASHVNFAAVPTGPGCQKTLQEAQQDPRGGHVPEEGAIHGLTTYRVPTKDREFTPEARYKGQTYRMGDYVHMINPNDATRPIVGQVWKTWVPTKGNTQQHHLTVCWYYRPEQTVHTAERLFFENEVFKSGHFCDHPVEDVLERISVQFYVKYIRGKPKAPEYYPGWPHYICNSRYNDREWLSIRVKNWASCIPEELRQTEYMSVVPYERQLDPVQTRSPFLRGVRTGPGFLAAPKRQPGAEDDEDDDGPTGRDSSKPKRDVGRPTTYLQQQQQQQQQSLPETPQVPPPASTTAAPGYGATGPRPGAPQSGPGGYLNQRPSAGQVPQVPPAGPSSAHPMHNTTGPQLGPGAPRSIAAAMGGTQAAHNIAVAEQLPTETAKLFERDQHRQVLWFSGPPLPVGAVKVPEQPTHSISYLEYLAKRKRGMSASSARPKIAKLEDGPGGLSDQKPLELDLQALLESEEGKPSDPMMTEWWADGLTKEQVITHLKATLNALG